MLKIPCTSKIDHMSAINQPAARCKDGDTVIFQTMDCFDGAVTDKGICDREGKKKENIWPTLPRDLFT